MSADLNAVFYLSLATLICGGFGLIIKLIYKIKCSDIECCGGCIKVHREIDDEIKLDMVNHTQTEKRLSFGTPFLKNNRTRNNSNTTIPQIPQLELNKI